MPNVIVPSPQLFKGWLYCGLTGLVFGLYLGARFL